MGVCVCVCAAGGAHCSASGENAVKHITSQGDAHHEIHSVAAEEEDEEESSQFLKQNDEDLKSAHVDVPHAHEIARLLSRQVVRAERDHPPEVVLLLSSTQAADCKARNVAFCHFCER